MKSTSAIAAIAATLTAGALLGGCAQDTPAALQAPAHATAAAPQQAAAPAPAATAHAAEKPAAAAAQPAAAAKAAAAQPAAPAPAPEAQAGSAAKPAGAPQAQAPSAAGKAQPAAAKPQDREALSWYYMKKGAGKVPDFPKETRTFPSEQKAVWVGTGKKVYLTFDTGGPMGDTELLLKSLKDNKVHASFFIAGYNLKKDPAFLKRLVADGHLVANHTMTHRDFNLLSDDDIRKEITDFEKLYKDITGQNVVKWFRFPYGRYNRHVLSLVSDMGYTSVFWSTAMKDWEPRKNGADDAYNDIMANLHDGNVILMHQGSKENIEALDKIIKGIKDKGYEFDTVDHLQPPPR